MIKRVFFYSVAILVILLRFDVYAQDIKERKAGCSIEELKSLLSAYLTEDQINLPYLREVSNLLTDEDQTTIEGIPMAKRRKAFKRNIKHINEALEQAYIKQQQLDSQILYLLYEIEVFRRSLLQKSKQDLHPDVNFRQKVRMGLQTAKSRRVFKYKIPEDITLEMNEPICDRYFWSALPPNVRPEERFQILEEAKNIKAKKTHVMLFDELSGSGSTPKISVVDTKNEVEWTLKWGDEIHADPFASHVFAALGYDVDHPFYYGKDKIVLIFQSLSEVSSAQELSAGLREIFKVDISPFISDYGIITPAMVCDDERLELFEGHQFVTFKKCALEARPDRVKRIGSFIPNAMGNSERRELRGALLAHQFIDNWDTREENTLLSQVHEGNYIYHASAVFSDLGTCMGVARNAMPIDFKVGLVNELEWEVAIVKNGKIKLRTKINSILDAYKEADYYDLRWCAQNIAQIDSVGLRYMIKQAHWPDPIAELYFHKMASRRASILTAFEIVDQHPIYFDKNLTIHKDGRDVIYKGVLQEDYLREKHPESFISKKGRNRNYGH